ncbi:hypothetical protein [Streptomyces sp. NPDC020742]|uniref:hypothetical protein n=1 Tax=Streptomyces sp. NPDC020742 TaxID=3154897 RepID=UPI0033CA236E
MDGGTLHLGLLVPTAGTVLVLLCGQVSGLAQHLHHGVVPGNRLQVREAPRNRPWSGGGLPARRSARIGAGRPRPVIVHEFLI